MKVCRDIAVGEEGFVFNVIYYNRSFGENVDVYKMINFLNTISYNNINVDFENLIDKSKRCVFVDKEGTVIVLLSIITFLKIKNNIYFAEHGGSPKSFCEIFSQKECKKCLEYCSWLKQSDDGNCIFLCVCPRCGNILSIKDSSGSFVHLTVFLDFLAFSLKARHIVKEFVGYVNLFDRTVAKLKYRKQKYLINNFGSCNNGAGWFIWVEQWYNALKKKTNV